MRFKVKKLISVCFAVLILAVGANAACVSMPASAKTVDQLKDDLSELKNKAKEIENRIAELRKQQSRQEALEEALKERIANTQNQIAVCNDRIDSLNDRIDELNTRLKAAEDELCGAKELFRRRLRAIYMSGTTSDIVMILDSGSFSDLLAMTEFTRSVSVKDSRLMDDIIGKMEEISAAKKEIEEKKADQESVKKELSALKKSLNSQMFEAQEAAEAIADKTDDAKDDLKKIQNAMDEYEREIERALAAAAARTGSKLVFGSVAFQWPAPGFYHISSPFGYRIHPITGKRSLHGGVDIAGSGISNTPAKAAAGGTVLTAAWNSSYGYYVLIYHGRGSNGKEYATLYAHLWSYCVHEGDSVTAGQKVGNIGSTGSSTGPHLHFEVRIKDAGESSYTRVNPMQYF